MGKFLVCATEAYNNDDNINTVIDPVDLTSDQEILADQSEIIQDVVSMGDAMNTAIESIDTLVAIHDVIRESSDVGISGRASQIVQIAMENIHTRLGYKKKPDIPVMEHFDNQHTTVAATRVSMEGIGKLLSDIWSGIVAIFKKIFNSIVELFSGAASKAEEKRAESYAAIIEANKKELQKKDKKDLPTGGSVSDFKYVQMFTLPDEAASVKTIERILLNTISTLDKFKTLAGFYKVYIETVERSLDTYEIAIRMNSNFDHLREIKKNLFDFTQGEVNEFYTKCFSNLDHSKATIKDKETIARHPESKITLSSDYLIAGNHFLFFKDPIPHFVGNHFTNELVIQNGDNISHQGSFEYPNKDETLHLMGLFTKAQKAVRSHYNLGEATVKSTTGIMKRLNDIDHLVKHNFNYTDDEVAIYAKEAKEQASIVLGLLNGPILLNGKVYAEVKKTMKFVEDFMRKLSNYYGLGKEKA